jgi:hypothetical protein
MTLFKNIQQTKKLIKEDMSYKSFFGKEVSHQESLKESLISELVNIVTEEQGISEKAFSAYDEAIAKVKAFVDSNESVMKEAQSRNTIRKV